MVDDRTDFSRSVNDKVIAPDVRRRGEQITRIVNVSNQEEAQSGEREGPARMLNWQRVISQGSTVLAGDVNAPITQWDSKREVQRNAAFWEDVIDENGVEVAKDGRPTHHWARQNQEGESVIDLTLPNQPIVKWAILADDHATGSNRDGIEWEVGVDTQEEQVM